MSKLQSIPWTMIDSSNVKAAYRDDKHSTVVVQFNNGGLYTYMGVNLEIYMGFLHAPSVGQYLHNVLKAFPYTRHESEQDIIDYLNT